VETLAVLDNETLVTAIRKSAAEFKAGRYKTLDQVKKEFLKLPKKVPRKGWAKAFAAMPKNSNDKLENNWRWGKNGNSRK
jgi:hypothetical protein